MIIGDCPRGSPLFYKSEEYYGYCFIFARNTRSERYEKAYVEAAK